MRRLLAALILAFAAGGAGAAPYVTDSRTCDGFPRAPIETAAGICAGVILQPSMPGPGDAPRMPRTLLPIDNTEVLVTDLGGWDPGRGAVWKVFASPGGPRLLQRLLIGLDMPHTIARGPDGRVYVGEMSRIVRFDPRAGDPQATVETVVQGLPDNRLHENRHPLSSFIFDADGALLVNVGAPSDQCPPTEPGGRCAEGEGERPAAAIWRFAYLGGGRWAQQPTVFARGLRNSLAMVRTPAGTLLQAENSIDVDAPYWPAEEINRLQAGRHYGWPYCVGAGEPSTAWRGKGPGCRDFTKPALLLPPHGAPLGMAVYDGPMFPQLKGRLLVSLHGFRSTGSRLMAYELDASGSPKTWPKARYWATGPKGLVRRPYGVEPSADGLVLTPGWKAVRGRRPAGAPVGIAVTPDGAIWVADDRNGAILRFARDRR